MLPQHYNSQNESTRQVKSLFLQNKESTIKMLVLSKKIFFAMSSFNSNTSTVLMNSHDFMTMSHLDSYRKGRSEHSPHHCPLPVCSRYSQPQQHQRWPHSQLQMASHLLCIPLSGEKMESSLYHLLPSVESVCWALGSRRCLYQI